MVKRIINLITSSMFVIHDKVFQSLPNGVMRLEICHKVGENGLSAKTNLTRLTYLTSPNF